MQISLLVQSAPVSSPNVDLALRFALAVIAAGHAVRRVFFYKDAAALANRFAESPQDEATPARAWQALAVDHGVELCVCVAAGQRRGVVDDTLAEGFEIVGLGQMIEALIESDRTVTF